MESQVPVWGSWRVRDLDCHHSLLYYVVFENQDIALRLISSLQKINRNGVELDAFFVI